jgi:hypothetical protein
MGVRVPRNAHRRQDIVPDCSLWDVVCGLEIATLAVLTRTIFDA